MSPPSREAGRGRGRIAGEGVAAGEGIPALQRRVQAVFTHATGARTEAIARTEVVGASNAGKLAWATQTGEVETKSWLAALDDRTRPTHVSAHGQTVPLDGNFTVGGVTGPAPHQFHLAREVVNCRCTMTFGLKALGAIPPAPPPPAPKPPPRASLHPSAQRGRIDDLLRDLVEEQRLPTATERADILSHLAQAPFWDHEVPVHLALRGAVVDGVELGATAPSLQAHVPRHVIHGRHWEADTTPAQYLADVRAAIQSDGARLALYTRQEGVVALVVANTLAVVPSDRLGSKPLAVLAVVYAADRGAVVSGYQARAVEALNLPGFVLWS